jgi:hypothetical protein
MAESDLKKELVSKGVDVAVGFLGGLFKSKKHYHLYYWEPGAAAWRFVLDGHPSQVNPVAKNYTDSGLVVAIVRNKDDKAPDGTLAPTSPPAGYKASSSTAPEGAVGPWLIAGGIGGAALLVFFLVRKGRR